MRILKRIIAILLIFTVVIGCSGCVRLPFVSPENRIINHLNKKYDDKFEYHSTFGGSLFKKSNTILCTSKKHPDALVWAFYSNEDHTYGDNYLYIKYSDQYDAFVISLLQEAFPGCDLQIDRNSCQEKQLNIPESTNETTFEEFLQLASSSFTMSAHVDISNTVFDKETFVSNLESALKQHNYSADRCELIFVYDTDNKIDVNNDSEYQFAYENNSYYYLEATIADDYTLHDIEWEDSIK